MCEESHPTRQTDTDRFVVFPEEKKHFSLNEVVLLSSLIRLLVGTEETSPCQQ